MAKIKKVNSFGKATKQAHTANTAYGMGDHYGTGFKNPIGRMRGDSVGYRPVTKSQLGTPPKSVV